MELPGLAFRCADLVTLLPLACFGLTIASTLSHSSSGCWRLAGAVICEAGAIVCKVGTVFCEGRGLRCPHKGLITLISVLGLFLLRLEEDFDGVCAKGLFRSGDASAVVWDPLEAI